MKGYDANDNMDTPEIHQPPNEWNFKRQNKSYFIINLTIPG